MRRSGLLVLAVGLPLGLLWSASRSGDEPSDLAARARASLSQTSGSLRVPGLRQRVEVLRDRWGIPHIYASSEDDLFLAQGFVQAQDRLYQMELWRRSSQGRLAELLGPDLIERDRLTRLVGRYRGDRAAEWASYGPEARSTVESFVRGVNAWIVHLDGRRPLELELAGMDLEPWSPEDLLSRAEAFGMSGNAISEALRARVVAGGGVALAQRLRPPDPPVDLIVPAGLPVEAADGALEAALGSIGAEVGFGSGGSNNWVVAGRRSVTGRPLLANDPHRALDSPSLRYLVHLEAPGLRLMGAVVPWFPGIAIGHNGRVGWGLTILRIDAQDLYAETLHPEDPGRYRVGETWEPLREERETIRVKGSAPVEVALQYSRHGPLVHVDPARRVAWALRWTGQEPGTAGYLGALALGRARSAAELRAACRRWKMPGENFVFADVEGTIGYQAAGLAPVRRGWSGLLPVPGAGGAYAWDGFLAEAALPAAGEPPSGYLATANHNVLPEGHPHPVGHEWAERYRIERVHELLRRRERFSVEDFQAFQHDVTALLARDLVPLLRTHEPPTPRLRRARDLLLGWDGRMSRDSAAAALFAVWQHQLVARWVQSEARDQAGASLMSRALTLTAAVRALRGLGPGGRTLLLGALDDATLVLERRLGSDLSAWRWGDLHQAWFAHPLGMDEATRALFDRGPIPRPGHPTTVNAAAGTLSVQTSGASFRMILDVGDWDRSVATSAPGQSGQPGSPHYDDLIPYWAEERYFPLAFSRGRVEEVADRGLTLEPARP